jgi:hypothetical protein
VCLSNLDSLDWPSVLVQIKTLAYGTERELVNGTWFNKPRGNTVSTSHKPILPCATISQIAVHRVAIVKSGEGSDL